MIFNAVKSQKRTRWKTIRDLLQKFQQADMLVGNVGPTHSVVTPENAKSLAVVVQHHPTTYVRRLAE